MPLKDYTNFDRLKMRGLLTYSLRWLTQVRILMQRFRLRTLLV